VSTHKLTVTYDVTDQDLEDLLTSAFEGGIGYWADIALARDAPRVSRVGISTSAGPSYLGATVTPSDDRSKATVLTREKMLAGLALCANAHPNHFADWLLARGDATTADVIVQCAAFGEVRYG
jgi:hypothetical protein